jgi:hypothetical protein
LSIKWLTVDKEVAYKRVINCNNAIELRNIGKSLHKILCKWKNKISNTPLYRKSGKILSVSKSHRGRIHDFKIRKQEKR